MKKIIRLLIIAAAVILLFHLSNTKALDTAIEVDCSTYAHKLYCLTNEKRVQNNKKPLLYSAELQKVSENKSKDMCAKVYFSHDYNGKSWTRFIKQSGIDYHKAGENLAKGYSRPEDAMTALMNSPKHYENIMDDYTHIGIYTEECGGVMLTTQTFAKL